MAPDVTVRTIPIHGYDVRCYFECPSSMEVEIHCYRRVVDANANKLQIVLRMCFYRNPDDIPLGKPDYDNLPIDLHYPLERFAPIYAVLHSGAPVEFFYEKTVDGKLFHRLHANTVGWISDHRLCDLTPAGLAD